MAEKNPKVLVGMSGGVDSSVSAALLLEQGYDVIGAFMKNWSGDVLGSEKKAGCENGSFEECGWRAERRDAMRVAAHLGIPFLTFDFEEEYRRDVIEYMFKEFEKGRTPNPDVMCNKYVKFDLFLKEADKLGCAFVATGHYARVERDNGTMGLGPWDNGHKILAGSDTNKDQTYFLWAIKREVLPRVLFPVGHMLKSQVRQKARELGLPVAEKKDSMGICFVGKVNMRAFLQSRIKPIPGDVVSTSGELIGRHEGLPFYTIGQREGLSFGGGTPYYLVEKRPEQNQLVVSSNYDQALYRKNLSASETNWFREPNDLTGSLRFGPSIELRAFGRDDEFSCEARIRYRQPLERCTVTILENGRAEVVFDKPQRAVTPGQSIVFYDGEVMLGGGIID